MSGAARGEASSAQPAAMPDGACDAPDLIRRWSDPEENLVGNLDDLLSLAEWEDSNDKSINLDKDNTHEDNVYKNNEEFGGYRLALHKETRSVWSRAAYFAILQNAAATDLPIQSQ
ncbi:MAG: hypothetical protein Q9191_008020 [Dirinaria sp. TL-2023a]